VGFLCFSAALSGKLLVCFSYDAFILSCCPVIIEDTLRLALIATPFDQGDLWGALGPPLHLAKLDMLEDYVDLFLSRIVNDLEQADDVGVPGLLENGNLAFDLVFVTCVLAQASTFGVAIYNLDGHVLSRVQVLAELDLAMHAAPELVDYLILVDDFAARNRVVGHVCNVALFGSLSVSMMKPGAGVETVSRLTRTRRDTFGGVKEARTADRGVASGAGGRFHDIAVVDIRSTKGGYGRHGACREVSRV
jgi:hypothetical protein